jgi:hypothetical protein
MQKYQQRLRKAWQRLEQNLCRPCNLTHLLCPIAQPIPGVHVGGGGWLTVRKMNKRQQTSPQLPRSHRCHSNIPNWQT